MNLTEEKIRQISQEAQRLLGKNAHPTMIKKVVKEVVRRLMAEANTDKK